MTAERRTWEVIVTTTHTNTTHTFDYDPDTFDSEFAKVIQRVVGALSGELPLLSIFSFAGGSLRAKGYSVTTLSV